MKGIQDEGKIDGHYKAFLRMKADPYLGPKFGAVVFSTDWQELRDEGTDVADAVRRMALQDLIEENGLFYLPTSVETLPLGLELLRKMGATLRFTAAGRTLDESVWLVGGSKRLGLEECWAEEIKDSCDGGADSLIELLERKTTVFAIKLAEQLATMVAA